MLSHGNPGLLREKQNGIHLVTLGINIIKSSLIVI